MTSDDAGGGGKKPVGKRPANDNRPPKAQGIEGYSDASKRLEAVVFSIARLIGRQMARDHHQKALRAANDNVKPGSDGTGPGSEDAESP